MPTPANTAAWLDAPFATLKVRPAPYSSPGPDQIVVRNRAIAVNPLDRIKQSTGNLMYRWLPYPSVLGEDVAGEVVEVGSNVTRFRVGDRVLAYAVGMEKNRNHAAEGGFQLFTVVQSQLAAALPDNLSFADGVVLPLAISTAASALFQRDQLSLRHPVPRVSAPASSAGQSVLVWGGSTSVGLNAIQLAVAAGYRVVATASPHNHDLLRSLGASDVFDYRDISEITTALGNNDVAGILSIGTGSAEQCVAIAAAVGAKRVAMTSMPVSLSGLPQRVGLSLGLVSLGLKMVGSNLALQLTCLRHGIRARFVWGSTLMSNEVGPQLWGEFLPAALAEGSYVSAPRAHVVGSGLASLQGALEALDAGVSARKLVVTLD